MQDGPPSACILPRDIWATSREDINNVAGIGPRIKAFPLGKIRPRNVGSKELVNGPVVDEVSIFGL